MGKFTFPATLDLEEQEQILDRGGIVNTILVTPYKCAQHYGASLGGVSGCAALRSNPDCSVRSILSPPISAIIAAVMSFDSDLNDAFLHSAAYAVLFFFFSRTCRYPATKLKRTITFVFSLPLLGSFILYESDHPYISEKDLITLPPLPSLLYQY